MSPLTILICAACFPLGWLGCVWLASLFRPDQPPAPPQYRGYGVTADKQWKYKTGWGSRPL